MKEARLLCTFSRHARHTGTEFPAPHGGSLGLPVHFRVLDGGIGNVRRNSLLAQLGANTDRSLSSLRMMVNKTGDEPLVRDQSPGFQPCNNRGHRGFGMPPHEKLAPQFFYRMLTAGEQTYSSQFSGLLE
ncbi:MAG TPA: hypothetical protein VFR96_02940 [Povalibacter sp.]|nr:hypothetical protein [Povalibacter sp.]